MHRNNDRMRRWFWGLLAFAGPILLGVLVVNTGGYVLFWLLCYFLMVFTPLLIILYLVYKYIFQIAAEKVEDRYQDRGEEFLLSLPEQFDVIEEAVWNKSMRDRSLLVRKKPFDRLALEVSGKWHSLPDGQKQQLLQEIAGHLYTWIRENCLEKKNHRVRLDLFTDLSDPFSQVERYESRGSNARPAA